MLWRRKNNCPRIIPHFTSLFFFKNVYRLYNAICIYSWFFLSIAVLGLGLGIWAPETLQDWMVLSVYGCYCCFYFCFRMVKMWKRYSDCGEQIIFSGRTTLYDVLQGGQLCLTCFLLSCQKELILKGKNLLPGEQILTF